MRWLFFSLGMLAIGCAVMAFFYYLNARVEIDGEEIAWYDWRGKLRVKAFSRDVESVDYVTSIVGRKTCWVETANGLIKFSTEIGNFGLLKSLLMEAKDGFSNWEVRHTLAFPGSYQPAERSFNYRWSYLHFFSFMWLGVIGLMLFVALFIGPLNGTKETTPFFMYVVLFLFALPGVWMQMTGWIEKISIGPAGIVWINWQGKVKIQASLDDIISLETQRVSNDGGPDAETLRVFTKQGTISAMSYLKGYKDLKAEIQKVLDSRAKALASVNDSPSFA